MTDKSLRKITTPAERGLSGNRADRVIVDDPAPVSPEEHKRIADKFFAKSYPVGKGRRSIPRSHRAEGHNWID